MVMEKMEKVLPSNEWSRDWGAIYTKKLLSLDGVKTETISLDNYVTKYNWVKSFIQAEIMQELYQDNVGSFDSGEGWVKKFSDFFNKALEIEIEKHGNDILEMLRIDFLGTVSKIRALLRALYQAEHKVEEDMHLGSESRKMILDEIARIIAEHPEVADDTLSLNEIIPQVEKDINEHTQ